MGLFRIMKQIIQTEHNKDKNASWKEAKQMTIYKLDRGFELGTTGNKSGYPQKRDLTQG